MSYTPAAIDMLVAAADRSTARRRATFMSDVRAARFAEDADFKKLLRELEGMSRAPR